jgi:adenylate kinase
MLMNLILLGTPGVGKGTQAQLIEEKYRIPQISTGDILRAEIQKQSDLGKKVQALMARGELVSDEIMLEIMKYRLNEPDSRNGFILDGFPRTIQQAKSLDTLLEELSKTNIKALNIIVPEVEIIKRLSSRRVCVQCGKTYNLYLNPPPEDGKCQVCGGEIIQRDDDKEATIRKRLAVYMEKTAPLISYYREKGNLFEVDGMQTLEKVFADIERIIRDD